MVRLTVHHPNYQEVNELMDMIVMAKNPHMFFDIVMDVDEDTR